MPRSELFRRHVKAHVTRLDLAGIDLLTWSTEIGALKCTDALESLEYQNSRRDSRKQMFDQGHLRSLKGHFKCY